MTISIEPLHCGTLTSGLDMFEADRGEESITIPVPSWLIRHPEGLVVIDTGMNSALAEPGSYLDIISMFFTVDLDAGGLIRDQLAARDVDAADIDVAIVTHLHFDHSGGLGQLPNARLVVQADEWAAGHDDELAVANNLNPKEFDLGHDLVLADGEHDVFGDGRITCIPTPGHTPGHQSVRVRLEHEEVVVCGDCAYFQRTLDGGPLPSMGHDLERQAQSIERLRTMGRAGARLIPGHDPAAFAALPDRLV